MGSDKIAIDAEKRVIKGKKVRVLREQGYVPATIYEKGKESINISVPYVPMTKVYAEAGLGQPVALSVAGKKYLTMIKDVHIDPAKNTIVHVAFHAVNAKDPVEAEIAVHLEGDIPAESKGNFIVRPNDHVLVKALPADLPEVLNIDATKLQEPGDQLTVADIPAIDGVEFLSESNTVLATVEEPRVVEEEPEESEEEVDAADVPSDNGGDKAEDSEAKPEDKS